jgi:hypothetical protein
MMRLSLSSRWAPCVQRGLLKGGKHRGAAHHIHLGVRSALRNVAACHIHTRGRQELAGKLQRCLCLANGP